MYLVLTIRGPCVLLKQNLSISCDALRTPLAIHKSTVCTEYCFLLCCTNIDLILRLCTEDYGVKRPDAIPGILNVVRPSLYTSALKVAASSTCIEKKKKNLWDSDCMMSTRKYGISGI